MGRFNTHENRNATRADLTELDDEQLLASLQDCARNGLVLAANTLRREARRRGLDE